MRILFIEDDGDFREVVTEVLEQEGHEVLAATDGNTGYQMLVSQTPDAVIVDQGIPGLSGTDLIRRVRKDSRFQDLPILLMSGEKDVAEIADELSLKFFIRKPPSLEELFRQVGAMSEARAETIR